MTRKGSKKAGVKTSKGKVRQGKKKALYLKLYWLFGFSFFALIALWCLSPTQQWIAQRKEISLLNQKIAQLKKENSLLEEEKAKLSTDEYVEQIARKELGLIKPGEEAYVVIPSPKPSKAQNHKVPKKEEPNIWQRIRNYLDKL